MGHFNDWHLGNIESRTADDDYLDRIDGIQYTRPAPQYTSTAELLNESTLTPEQRLTRQAEVLYYRLVERANHAFYDYRSIRYNRPEKRAYWRKIDDLKERAYLRMLRRRRITGGTYWEGA